jgi:NADH-quinone oxidoreductase subunit N
VTIDFSTPIQFLWALLPETVLALAALAVLVADAFAPSRRAAFALTLGGLAAATAANAWLLTLSETSTTTMIAIDAYRVFANFLFLGGAALVVGVAGGYLEREGIPRAELYALLLFATIGMMVMAGTRDLIVLFLGFETMSIASYVLAGLHRRDPRSAEAALKYFLLGAFSTGFILYGIALFYGVTGRIDLRGIAAAFVSAGGRIEPLFLVAVALTLIGLGFKAAVVPFHFWAPDVYQGSLAPVAGFMATGTKAAAFAMLIRVLNAGLPDAALRDRWVALLGVLAVLTMVLGNLVALAQQNVKRMLAYSSIANAGYLLVAVVAGGRSGRMTPVVVFYLAAYAFMTIGAFAVAALVGRAGEDDQGYAVSAYAGLGRRRPLLAGAMAIFMLSLTGIPPTGGFMGKFYVFKSAVDAGLYGLAIVGVLASVVSAYYYLRIVVQMYLREPGPGAPAVVPQPPERLAVAAAAAATLWIGLFPGPLIELAERLI